MNAEITPIDAAREADSKLRFVIVERYRAERQFWQAQREMEEAATAGDEEGLQYARDKRLEAALLILYASELTSDLPYLSESP